MVTGRLLLFVKNWTLPIAMVGGALAYLLARELPLSIETQYEVVHTVEIVQPLLLFAMLFVSFCKVPPSALKPRLWHFILATVQCVFFAVCCVLLWMYPSMTMRYAVEGFMLAMICPTATACAVVTQKLGGDSATTTAYTILINVIVALIVPALLPLIHPHEAQYTFVYLFWMILTKVFPLLVIPLLLAWGVRYGMPKLHALIIKQKDLAFYLWSVALALAIAVTVRALCHSNEPLWNVAAIAASTAVACVFQFVFGKWIGGRYGNVIEGGQAMGQKNTIFIIWLGYSFVSPISATAGGFYSIWHNVFNTWQLYKKRKES